MIGDADHAAANSAMAGFMERLAAFLFPHFPLHANALRGETAGRRLTTDRWNRIAALLASLHSVPGPFLRPEQHDARNAALAAIPAVQKMAAAGFIWREDPARARDFALWLAAEISDRIARQQARTR